MQLSKHIISQITYFAGNPKDISAGKTIIYLYEAVAVGQY